MKICMMTNTYLPHVGGVARSVQTFAEDLRKRRHAVLVVAPNYSDENGHLNGDEKHVVRLPAIQRFNGSDFSVRVPGSWMMDEKLESFSPDIVHSHHPYLIGDSALRYAAGKNAPVVFTHHTLHEEYTHYVPFDSQAFKRFVIELCTQYANLCDAVIAPSESIAQLIQARGVTTPIEVIPTGIDVKAFSTGRRALFRHSQALAENAFVVGHVGRLAKEKNLSWLARAVCAFLKDMPEARFLVVGNGAYADSLRRAFRRRKLEHRLLMPGTLCGQDLSDAYSAMDAFVFSSFTETQGMVLAEAMAAGLPVVALDAPGAREVVRDGENGFLLPAKATTNAFAARLMELALNPPLREQMKAGARRTAKSFSRGNSIRKTIALYENVLSWTRRSRAEAAEDAFGALLKRIEIEWALLSEKAGAIVDAVRGNRKQPALEKHETDAALV